MTQALLRTNFNSSRLIRFLADLAVIENVESKQTVAQRLGEWVRFTDADTLYTTLENSTAQSVTKSLTVKPAAQSAVYSAMNEELTRIRTALIDSVNHSCTVTPGTDRIQFPAPKSGAPIETASTYAPFHHFYQTMQREMDTKINPLRARIRKTLMAISPALEQLATLDAAFDQIMSDRERRLFSAIPSLLKKRFDQLFKAHQQTLARTGEADDTATWMRPGAWLATFRDELHSVLLAELDVRLQPLLGLVEAFKNQIN